MAQRRISMREGPLAELFKSTTAASEQAAAAGEVDDGGEALAAKAKVAHSSWRPTALAVLTLATLELGLFTAVAVALLTRPPTQRPIPVPPTVTRTIVIRSSPPRYQPTGRRPPVASLAPRSQTWVLILNGNGISGAAASTAEIVRAHGYPVAATADAPRFDYPRSVIMYKPGFAGEARRLAHDLNTPTLQPLDPLAVPRGTRALLVLIVGRGTG